MVKKCFKCGKSKDLGEFYVHKEMADGHLGKCKECNKRDANEHRARNLDKIRRYDRERAKLPHRRKQIREYTDEYKKKFPLRKAASTIVNNAVRDGRLKKPKNCSKCGKMARIYGHHDDYYKPLDVIWLCQVCHKQLHKEEKNRGTQIQIH